MGSNMMARDMSDKRKWTRTSENGSYMFSIRIPEPLLSDFRTFCEETGMTPSDAMRTALRVYMDGKVRRIMRRRIMRYEGEIVDFKKI